MKLVNLKQLYPDVYFNDLYTIVEDKVYKTLNREIPEKKTFVILIDDCDSDLLFYNDQYEFFFLEELLHASLKELPLKQMNRIYEVYYLGLSKSEIARIEGCSEGAIRKSIKRGLRQLKRKIKKQI